MRWISRRGQWPRLVLLGASLLAGCGTVAGSGSASPAATSLSMAGSGPSTALGGPSIAAPAGSGATAVALQLSDPDLAMRLPDGWIVESAGDLRKQAERAGAGAPKDVAAAYEQLVRLIDDGEVRGGGAGPSGLAPWTAVLIVGVAKADSLDALVDRVIAFESAGLRRTSKVRSMLATPLGDAVRVEVTAEVPSGTLGVPARGLTYFVELGDGRAVWINATGPQASTTLGATIDGIVGTLARR
jgi:hypothetical protein